MKNEVIQAYNLPDMPNYSQSRREFLKYLATSFASQSLRVKGKRFTVGSLVREHEAYAEPPAPWTNFELPREMYQEYISDKHFTSRASPQEFTLSLLKEATGYEPGDVITHGDSSTPFINMTFDDFWGAEWYVRQNLTRILELGEKYGATFTLCPVGSALKVAKDLWREAAKKHEIANHSLMHPLFGGISKNQMRAEIFGQQAIAQQTLGDLYTPQRLFRPPGGDGVASHKRQDLFDVVREDNIGMILLMWSEGSPGVLDYPRNDGVEVNKIINACPPNQGSIVLMHGITVDPIAAEYILQHAANNGVTSRSVGREIDAIPQSA